MALLNYFIEEHEKDGYEFILPPHILNYACGYTAGQFPKFQNDDRSSFLEPVNMSMTSQTHYC